MKGLIQTGKFTPPARNSRTHWTATVNGFKYRSSWEALWHYINPWLDYETVRVQYLYEGKTHNYTVDFVDRERRKLIEVKPIEHCSDSKTIAKELYAKQWCKENGYSFEFVTQYDILEAYSKLHLVLPTTITGYLTNLYEKTKNR